MRRLAVCAVVMLAAVSGWAATAVSVPDGGSVEFESDTSDFNNVYFFGRNCTLKLKGTAAEEGELFQFTSPCIGTNGAFTVDASELQGYAGIRWRNHLWATGGVVRVVGTDRIVFGSNTKIVYTSTGATLCGAAFSFVQADGETPYEAPTGLVFTNQVTLAIAPGCPYEVLPDTWFWIGPWYGPNNSSTTFGDPEAPYVVESGFKVGIVHPDSIRASKFVVNEGAEMCMRPCSLQWAVEKNWLDPWKWGGTSKTWDMPIELNGGVLYAPCNSDLTVNGAITGAGNIVLQGNATLRFQGEHTFTGTVGVNCAQAVFGHTSPGDPANVVMFEDATRGRLFLRPAGWNTGASTTCRVGGINGSNLEHNSIRVQNNQTVTIGSIAGSFRIEGTGTNNVVVVESLAAGTKLMVDDGVDVTILAVGAGAEVVLSNALGTANWTLRGPPNGARLKLPVSFSGEAPAAAQATFGGKLELPGVLPFARVEIVPGGDVVGVFPEACALTVNGAFQRASTWQDKVAFWLDADAPESVSFVKDVSWATPDMNTQVNGNELVYMWRDRRLEQVTSIVAKNVRFSKESDYSKADTYRYIYPEYVLSGGPNDKPYFCFSHGQSTRMAFYKNATEIKTSGAIETAWAIVVFGCQNVSPGSVLSSVGAVLARDAAVDKPIFKNEPYTTTETYLDGVRVVPGTTGFKSGAWQIVSFDAQGAKVDGLNGDQVTTLTSTSMSNTKNANYAEVILFGEKPTESERQEAERYLAEKWGLEIAHQGAVVPLHASGSGDISLTTGTKLAGVASGTIALNGQRLELEEGRLVPREANISDEDRVLWFDPSLVGSVQLSAEEGRTREIAQILPRGNAGLDEDATYYLQSAYAADYATNVESENRRPQLVEGARGGSADKWIDFANVADDAYPNNLMLRVLSGGVGEPLSKYNNSSFRSQRYKTVFAVIDTSRGGGTPFSHFAGASSGDIIRRGTSYKDPIWNSRCTDIIKNGTTWLDGVEVNGTTQGFNGRPELMTFQPAAEGGAEGTVTAIKAFACCNLSTSTLNQEILGEILAFNRVLPDEERADVEAYLMRKWLGKAATGYVDFRDVTVTGAGTVAVGSQEALPKFGSDFAGTVELADGALAFTLDATDAMAAPQVKNALKLGANALKLPETVTVNVAVEGKAASGTYTLIEADVGDVDVGTWNLQVTGAGSLRPSLVAREGAVGLELSETGTVIFVR